MKVYSEIQLNQSNRYGEIAPKVYNVVHIEMKLGEDIIIVPFKYRWSDELGEYYHRMGVPECSFDMYLEIKAHLYDLLQEQYPSIFNEVFNANR